VSSLCAAAQEMAAGLHDAQLGGGLFKKRIERTGKGKRGGFRTLVASNKTDRWIFVYGFSKSQRSNINREEQAALKKYAVHLLTMTAERMGRMQQIGELIEAHCNEEEKIRDPSGGPRNGKRSS
jgi:hypothetical protein